MDSCIFCKIAKGEIPSAKVYEDDSVFAFLSNSPNTKGHTLVIPKQHFENVFDIDQAVLAKVVIAGKRIAGHIKQTLGAVGINLANNNGKHAHQEVFHFHLHVIPRYEGDNFQMYGQREDKKPTAQELEEIASKISF